MKHLLKLLDLSKEEIIDILNLADQLKYETKHGIEHHHLKGKCLAMIFEKSSTRTRVSFEVGINQLGGYAVVLAGEGSQIGRGEPVQDTARVLSRYVDGIMIRTFEQKEVEDLAKYGSVPVINGLTDFCHPCQILADLMTIREYKGSFDGLKMCGFRYSTSDGEKLEIYLHRTHAAHLKALWRFFPAAPPFGVLRASNAGNARQSCAGASCFRAPGAEAAAVRHRQ